MKNDINPFLIVFTGPMFGSKTTKMIKLIERLGFKQKSVAIFKPIKDDRYSETKIVSHSGESMSAIQVTSGSEILDYLVQSDKVYSTIAIDEAFMIPGVSETVKWLYRKGVNVIISSLTLSARGDVFPEMKEILPWATEIKICTAVCKCGNDALYTYKNSDDDSLIQVGGSELYEPRCLSCHDVINSKE